MSLYSEFFGGGGGSGGGIGGWVMPILVSKTLPAFTVPGKVRILSMGAGGSGGVAAFAASGGNSPPWGVRVQSVIAGDVLAITLGASSKSGTSPGAGVQGGSTIVTLNGSTIMTAQGGEGGAFLQSAGTATAPAPTATVTGADWVVAGIRAGAATYAASGGYTGGAAVDVAQTALGRSPDITNGNGVGGAVGNNTGANPLGWLALANFGFALGAGTNNGDPGKGGVGAVAPGVFGGASGNSSTNALIGGGGGGGANIAASGFGGNGYVLLTFQPLE